MGDQRIWFSAYGARACWAHGMKEGDRFLTRCRTLPLPSGAEVHVVGELPPAQRIRDLLERVEEAGARFVFHDRRSSLTEEPGCEVTACPDDLTSVAQR